MKKKHPPTPKVEYGGARVSVDELAAAIGVPTVDVRRFVRNGFQIEKEGLPIQAALAFAKQIGRALADADAIDRAARTATGARL